MKIRGYTVVQVRQQGVHTFGIVTGAVSNGRRSAMVWAQGWEGVTVRVDDIGQPVSKPTEQMLQAKAQASCW
jgi:hypothetical protein